MAKAKKPAQKKSAKPKAKKSAKQKPAKQKPEKPTPGSAALHAELAETFSDPDDYDLDKLRALDAEAIPRIDRRARGVVQLSGETVVTGDFMIDGDLEVEGLLLVLGSIECTGYVYTGIHSCLVVGKDLRAKAVDVLRSYWLIGGGIVVDSAWLSTYGFLKLGGALRTRLLVVQQYFELCDEPAIEATVRVDTEYLPKDPAARAALDAALITDGLLDAEGDIDSWALLRAVARGEPVFR